MPASKLDPVLSVENPVSLIRSRIEEKRLFEARFLCRQLGDAIDAEEKAALERELAGLLDQVETLQQQARLLLAEGRKDRVAGVYSEMEAIAIDVPGLAEEKKAVEGAEAIVARFIAKATAPEAPAVPETPAVVQPSDPDEADIPLPAPRLHREKQGRRLWLVAVLAAILLLLYFVWRDGKENFSPALSPTPSVQTILIRPLAPAPPAVAEQPDNEKEVKPVDPPAEKSVPPSPSPSLKLGALQVEESNRR
jgi:hypothetical protein